MSPSTITTIVVVFFLLVTIFSSVKIAQEYRRAVIFRLGRVQKARGPGLILLIPFVEWATWVDLRVVTKQLSSQETVTRDGVAVKVNAVVWYRAQDPVKATISVQNWEDAVEKAAETGLRDVIGQNDLDGLLKNRVDVNKILVDTLRTTVAKWGIVIEAVEVKDLDIPEQMQRAIAKEAEAVRERRARVIKADGEMQASAKLAEAAGIIAQNPIALELRRLQTISEIGAEHNSTTVMMIPTEFLSIASKLVAPKD